MFGSVLITKFTVERHPVTQFHKHGVYTPSTKYSNQDFVFILNMCHLNVLYYLQLYQI